MTQIKFQAWFLFLPKLDQVKNCKKRQDKLFIKKNFDQIFCFDSIWKSSKFQIVEWHIDFCPIVEFAQKPLTLTFWFPFLVELNEL